MTAGEMAATAPRACVTAPPAYRSSWPAPFVTELNTAGWLPRLTHRCQARGVEVAAIWVHSDLDTMHEYIEVRDAPRDHWKLSHWDEYTSTLNTDEPPPGVHHTIDNRLGAATSLADQTRETLRKLMA
nr:hypothetical protein GCM10010200_048650 [Actinomadura rugatobispora]